MVKYNQLNFSLTKNYHMEYKKELVETLGKLRVFPIGDNMDVQMINDMREMIFLKMDENKQKSIYLFVDSDGGDPDAGFIGYDCLKAIHIPLIAIVNGYCKSSALPLIAGCRYRHSFPHSNFFFHSPTTGKKHKVSATFSFQEAYQVAEAEVERFKTDYQTICKKEFGISKSKLEELFRRGDLYGEEISPKRAMEIGIIQKIITKFPF